ncbi:uncharacterized protein LOC142231011 [Haematobia irritans]|uniref:uncharacterized protein LOC142231011 n=1 Tax=Haematobia irritans TaxID=7368 RepID=UPI003F507E51
MSSINESGKEGSDMTQCLNRVASIGKQLADINARLTPEELNNMDDSDLIVRLDYVENLHSRFDQSIVSLEESGEGDVDHSIRSEFLTSFFEVKAKIKRKLNTSRSAPCHPPSSTLRQFSLDEPPIVRRSRLPELKLPQFSGAYTDWPDFFAMFTTVVANDMEITKLEKFQHLRACLVGSALDAISSLEPSDASYDEAIKLLKNRFDNKLLNFQAHIKEIFALKPVIKGSASSLRQLSDKLNAHMRALGTMCKKDEIADGLLIYLVTSKLDTPTQAKWEEGLQNDQLPTWSSMANFLDKRCRMLENLEHSSILKVPTQMVNKKSNNIRSSLVTSGNALQICNFCDGKDHLITNCSKFSNLSPTLRFKEAKKLDLCLNCLRKGHRLSKCKSSTCRHCAMKHHSLLHMENSISENFALQQTSNHPTNHPQTTTPQTATISQSSLVSFNPSQQPTGSLSNNDVLLATAIILVKNKFGTFVPCRAILDSASQLNFITSRFAAQAQLKLNPSQFSISGIGEGNLVADKSVEILIKSCHNNYSASFVAVVIPTITEYQPNPNIDVNQMKIPQNVSLADPEFYKKGRIDILIGAGLFFDLMSVGQIRCANTSTILQKTQLGWVVSGGGSSLSKSYSLAAAGKTHLNMTNENLEDILKSFWEVEHNFEKSSKQSIDDIFCEEHFKKNTSRLKSGAYSVVLPKNQNFNELGESYNRALKRFMNLENKLKKMPQTKEKYIAFMNEYAQLEHMSPIVSMPKSTKTYFLPHHCVHKEDSTTTKLRVVFDGSAKTTTGLSLNDTLHSGPTIQSKLFDILIRFRFFKIALGGDICKMYRCVYVAHPDDYLQCILWRNDPQNEIKIYKLNTVTYGTKPAAFLAIRTMHQLSIDEEDSFPLGAEIVRRDFYVEDLISGGNSVAEVNEIRKQVSHLLQKGNFQIRKWCSNDCSVLDEVPLADRETFLEFHDGTDITKTLGLVWNPDLDNFVFTFSHISDNKPISKRNILSSIARFYDPLGLVGPIITRAKVLMQMLWKDKLEWDESLPQHLHSVWQQYVSTFNLVDKFIFPRFVSIAGSSVQIHAFCDASLSAYGACVYARSELQGQVKIVLLCSKSRVAPLKVLTIPKLELSAAALLAELLQTISSALGTEYQYHCWTDSMIVLSWLREESSNYNIFVANRVSLIQKITKNMIWHHVPTAFNPADILSRGATPEELLKSSLWKEGPDFLTKGPELWPKSFNFIENLPERRRVALLISSNYDLSITCKYANSFPKIQRTFAYVFRFLNSIKMKSFGKLSEYEIKMGTYLLIRNIQRTNFTMEFKALRKNENIPSSSKLFSLSPFLDSNGLIRVGGRLQNSILSFEAQHPIIIPKSHPVTSSLIMHYHQNLLHAGAQCLLANIRQKYWPIGGRKYVSAVINKCIRCFQIKPTIAEHLMENLPEERVKPSRAFQVTGLDFCGPFYYKSEVRNRPPIKSYVCIFVCFTTKATHLELVPDLSTSSFLLSLKRFVSIRGKPKTIWSDNATNFVGAKNELADLRQLFFDQWQMERIYTQCLEGEIEWKFIPPRSPHFGGLWEAAVKSAKYHFYRTVGKNILTFDELRTLICQISAILNSRPLIPLTDDPNDLEVLTPGHFLVGAPLTSFPEPDIGSLNINTLSRWQKVCYIQQIFWKKWSCSYLNLLQERTKWKSSKNNIATGAMVLVKDDNLPPLKWKMGRIVETICGSDGIVRVAIVKTSNGVSRRSVSKLSPLPIEDNAVESQSLPTGGGCFEKPLCEQNCPNN